MEARIVVQFCEDVRHELGGKFSIMGILGDFVEVRSFPYVFPKLCCNIIFEIPTHALPHSRFSFSLSINGAEKQSMDIPIHAFDPAREADKKWVRVSGGMELGNVEISEESQISVVAKIDENELSTDFCTLVVRLKSDGDQNDDSDD